MRDPSQRLECSFCGKDDRQVEQMVSGASGNIICNECVDLCNEVIEEDRRQKQSSRVRESSA